MHLPAGRRWLGKMLSEVGSAPWVIVMRLLWCLVRAVEGHSVPLSAGLVCVGMMRSAFIKWIMLEINEYSLNSHRTVAEELEKYRPQCNGIAYTIPSLP